MIKIAILGDIGAGKTFVSKLFGFPVFNADKEVKKILNSNYLINPTHPAHKAIGFYEVREYITGEKTMGQAIDMISVKTRQYAKKQRTWFRNQMSTWQVLNITKGFELSNAVEHINNYTCNLNSNTKN